MTQKKWKDNIVKMAKPPMEIYKFNGILSNYPWHFFTEWEHKTFKIYMEPQKTLNWQNNSEEEEQIWGRVFQASDNITKL